MTPDVQEIRRLEDAGLSYAEIAKKTNVSRQRIYQIVKEKETTLKSEMLETGKPNPIIERLLPEERRKVDKFLEAISMAHPHAIILQCPIASDNAVEIRMGRQPKSIREIDVIIAALKAVRLSFMKNWPHKKVI